MMLILKMLFVILTNYRFLFLKWQVTKKSASQKYSKMKMILYIFVYKGLTSLKLAYENSFKIDSFIPASSYYSLL